jgi:hypothetical protein
MLLAMGRRVGRYHFITGGACESSSRRSLSRHGRQRYYEVLKMNVLGLLAGEREAETMGMMNVNASGVIGADDMSGREMERVEGGKKKLGDPIRQRSRQEEDEHPTRHAER